MVLSEKIFTYQEYLTYDAELEIPYELVAGKIVQMPPESYANVKIAMTLMMLIIKEVGVARVSNKAEIIISGSRVTARIPDITVFSQAGVEEVIARNTSTIDLDMLPPSLVVEIVSPGKIARDRTSAALRDRDYRYKRSEYAARGIENYWIVDPIDKTITFLILVDGLYETSIYAKSGVVNIDRPFNLNIDLDALFL